VWNGEIPTNVAAANSQPLSDRRTLTLHVDVKPRENSIEQLTGCDGLTGQSDTHAQQSNRSGVLPHRTGWQQSA
jgi:hypothetical protein